MWMVAPATAGAGGIPVEATEAEVQVSIELTSSISPKLEDGGTAGAKCPASAAKTRLFLPSLYQMCNNDDEVHRQCICWSDDNKTFWVSNIEQFSRLILPMYFRHNNYASFVRQLNMYGFQRSTETKGKVQPGVPMIEHFTHEFFVKGRVDQLNNIHRKTSSYAKANGGGPRTSSSATSQKLCELETLVVQMDTDKQTMMAEIRSLKESQRCLEEKLVSANTALSFFGPPFTVAHSDAHAGLQQSQSEDGGSVVGSGRGTKRRKKAADGGSFAPLAGAGGQQAVFMTLILNELHKQNVRMDYLERQQLQRRSSDTSYTGYSSSGSSTSSHSHNSNYAGGGNSGSGSEPAHSGGSSGSGDDPQFQPVGAHALDKADVDAHSAAVNVLQQFATQASSVRPA